MGWQDAHLHEFEGGGLVYVMVDPEGDGTGTEVDPTVWSDGRPAQYAIDARLDQVAPQRGAHLVYRYDFGHDWEHDVVIEEIGPARAEVTYPMCSGGERRCAPEDCGGVERYQEMLEIARDPSHEEYDEMVAWLGEAFDPNEFDAEAVNRELRGRRPRRIARR